MRRCISTLVALLVGCGTQVENGLSEDEVSALRLLDSFETDVSAGRWSEAGWADASRGADGSTLLTRRAAAGATEGGWALSVPVRFAGQGYAQAYVGRAARFSFRGSARLVADVTLPSGAPPGLRAKLILFLGPDARWTEPPEVAALAPGATVQVSLPLAGAFDPAPERAAYGDVRGYGLKIEGSGLTWDGALGLDRVRLEGPEAPAPEDAPRPVGTFGGFRSDVPAGNGFLTFAWDGKGALTWPRLGAGGAGFTLGRMSFTSQAQGGPPRFIDWTSIEADVGPGATVRLSRAFPAARFRSSGPSFTWATSAATVAVVLDGKPTVAELGALDLSRMSEPWMLVYGLRGAGFDAPMLFTLERRPLRVRAVSGGVRVEFDGAAGAVNAMPLEGLRRKAAGWALTAGAIDHARRLVPVLAAFPVRCDESSEVRADGTVLIEDRYAFEEIADAWGTRPTRAAPVPPVVYRAGATGYPVTYPAAPIESWVATYYGPFAYVPGEVARYALPLPAGLSRLPVALRVAGDPVAARARAQIDAMVRESTPARPMEAFLDNDDRVAAFLAAALPTLGPAEAAIATSFATRAIEHGFFATSLQELTEPVTGQRYLNSAKYWASNEAFDKEWYTGRQLAALGAVSEAVDLDLARGLWPKARALYRYDRIFSDWATGSALSSTYGFTALCDGIHFAWEGMLATARMARLVGDEATYRDAAYRSARQQAALFALWHQAAWSKELGYAVGHLTGAPLPDAETRFAVDGFVEDYGAAMLELRSFWQTSNYLFFDNVPQFSFYRDLGIDAAVRTLEYEVMPALHPNWADADAMEPIDGKYYGTEYTAAHLTARALLFHDDPAALLAVWDASAGKKGSGQWYSMRRMGIGGPTLLAIERARAPLVEAPVDRARVQSASWDAASGTTSLRLVGRRTGTAVVRTRKPGGPWKDTKVWLTAGVVATVTIR